MRAFISVELPDEVKKKIAELITELKEIDLAVKWVETRNLHITLKFLGGVKENDLDELIEISTKAVAGSSSFNARFESLGTFPEGKNPRVIWVGTEEGGDKLCQLAESLENELSKAGFKRGEKAFKPHITIGRIKGNKGVDKLKEKMMNYKNPGFGAALIDRVHIMKSTLTPKGPVYETIKEVRL
ncbi:MAG: RNA 2',3'-cyclic phosphodiesterase [Candidatus Margulisbacteria bacterium]|nr:RNA 2',3'-cyclic phosphodiesterase [Candidatus Margulisiibacteriota bacterium]